MQRREVSIQHHGARGRYVEAWRLITMASHQALAYYYVEVLMEHDVSMHPLGAALAGRPTGAERLKRVVT